MSHADSRVSFLKGLEVVAHPVEPFVQRLLVLGEPLLQRLEVRRLEAVQAAATICATRDEAHVAEHAQMLGHLRLRQREVGDDRADRLLAADQRVENVAARSLGDRIEDVRGCSRTGDLNIFLYKHMFVKTADYTPTG